MLERKISLLTLWITFAFISPIFFTYGRRARDHHVKAFGGGDLLRMSQLFAGTSYAFPSLNGGLFKVRGLTDTLRSADYIKTAK